MRIPSSAIRNRIEYIFPGKVSLALSTIEIEFPPKSSPSFDLAVSIFSLFLFTTTLPLHPLHHIYHQNSKHRPVTSSIAAKLDPSIPPPSPPSAKNPFPKHPLRNFFWKKRATETSDREPPAALGQPLLKHSISFRNDETLGARELEAKGRREERERERWQREPDEIRDSREP